MAGGASSDPGAVGLSPLALQLIEIAGAVLFMGCVLAPLTVFDRPMKQEWRSWRAEGAHVWREHITAAAKKNKAAKHESEKNGEKPDSESSTPALPATIKQPTPAPPTPVNKQPFPSVELPPLPIISQLACGFFFTLYTWTRLWHAVVFRWLDIVRAGSNPHSSPRTKIRRGGGVGEVGAVGGGGMGVGREEGRGGRGGLLFYFALF